MEISKRIRHEHAEIRSLAQRILNQSDGDPGREQDFVSYEHQIRDHLNLFEAFFIKRMKEDAVVKHSLADIKSEHALVRKELKALHRGDKDSHQWTSEFRRFTERFEQLCHRHDALVAHAEASGRSEWLDSQYEQTKSRRQRSFLAPSGGRGSGAAMFVGAAAAAGAAFFLSRYLKSQGPTASRRLSRRTEWKEEGTATTASGIRSEGEVSSSPATETRPVFGFENSAPDTDGARTAPNPATAPNANGIIIN